MEKAPQEFCARDASIVADAEDPPKPHAQMKVGKRKPSPAKVASGKPRQSPAGLITHRFAQVLASGLWSGGWIGGIRRRCASNVVLSWLL